MGKKNKLKKKWLILGLSIFIFLVLLISAIEFTSHSRFCSTCHYMKPFYNSWKTSSHKDIECLVCHYPPGIRSKLRAKVEGLLQVGRYWTKLYLKSKPWAEIPDESCLRGGCHSKRLLQGAVDFKTVHFDHKIHLTDLKRGKKLRCTSCHSQIVQGEHITVTESTCFICHFKKSKHYPRIADCSHCHLREDLISSTTSRFNHKPVSENGFSCNKCHTNTILGDGAVPRENCYKCHWEQDRLSKYEDTDLMHTTHITNHKIECNQCHLEIQHKIIKDIESISDCSSCHFNLHEAQKILFSGQGGYGVSKPMPNPMFEKGLSCKGCHIFHEEKGGQILKSDTLFSKPEACESCHGQGFARLLKEWEISTRTKSAQMKLLYQKTSNQVKKSRSSKKTQALKLLEEAAYNIDLVDRGKSFHNIQFANLLLRSAYDLLQQSLESIGASLKLPQLAWTSELVPTECATCHTGIEEVSVSYAGYTFRHKNHLLEQNLNCHQCHSNTRQHGELIATREFCTSCHHRKQPKSCEDCHQVQNLFYRGGRIQDLTIEPDIMAEGEVGCQDCHQEQGKIFWPSTAKCADCHDEEYPQMMMEWQKRIKELHRQLQQQLSITSPQLKTTNPGLYKTATKLLKLLQQDGSWGVHNYAAQEEIMEKLLKQVQKN